MHVKRVLLGLLTLLFCMAVRADVVDVTVESQREDYMLFEPILMKVTLTNNSGQDLVFENLSTGESWLDFIVQDDSKQVVVGKDRDAAFPKLFLAAGETKAITANVTPLYSIRNEGSYHIQVVVRVAGRDFVTDPIGVTIVKGDPLWTATRTVDGALLTYTILSFVASSESAFFYLRVENVAENIVYATERLGPVGSFKDPTELFDSDNNLHILHSVGKGVFHYTRVNAKGEVLGHDNFVSVNGNLPQLVATNDGSVIVFGGKKDDPSNRRELLSTAQALIRKAPEKPLPMAPLSAPSAGLQSPTSDAATESH